ncbi:FAD-dependent oxidoreductase [Vibrio alfacsensis]|uniref:FAD-dependent oxidoreductase n=1 Tax=Vibrio alfacsensis TaxID=1074311 RepID=UPI00406850BE
MDSPQNNKIDLNQRIAILGAGAAGLSAAEALKQKGYKHITVFERTDHAGGKCLSVELGSKTYELGAGIVTENNTVPLQLAKQYGIPIEQVRFGQSIYVDKNGQQIATQSLTFKLKVLWQLFFRYRRILKQYRALESPGFHNLSPEITVPFDQFAKEKKMTDLANIFSLFLSGFGYCYSDHVPTAYVLKYVNRKTIVAYLKSQVYLFPDGIQELWTRVAKEHDVRFEAEITQINRGEVITIHSQAGAEEFDKLIVTSPLDETALFMDLSVQEQMLFEKIMYLDYQTILCTVNHFVEKTGYVPENFIREREGHPVFWYYRQAGQPIYSFYVLTDKNISEKDVTDNLRTFVCQMGGEIESIHQFIHWKYFPHVDSAEMNDGFYDKLDKMQGNQHTYYAGEILNFSCVGFTSEYADYIVHRYF